MNSTTQAFSKENEALFSALLPVLIQCFGVILLGYFAGKFKALTESQAKGLGTYVTKFALPSIFFSVMVTIDFTGVDWYVVLAVSLAKMIMFVTTLAITLIVSRGQSVGLAGLLAMFTSQSNDVALAYPVLRLLYPDLASYIYLFAPAQLVILNPFAYFALEWHSVREKAAIEAAINGVTDLQGAGKSDARPPQRPSILTCREFLKVIRFVVSNPLFFMTLIGVIFNLIFHHRLPIYVEGFFKTLGDSFGATALFYLGFSMVGRLKTISRHGVHILVLILLGKTLVLPFITREVTVLLLSHQPQNISVPKSSFTFLYGGAPTAPPIFLFASQYDLMPEVIGAGLVIGTFLFAPMMFLFAGMATLVNVEPAFYDTMLERTAVYFAWASILCCTWTLIILVVSKKAFRMPYRFLGCLIISVLIFCLSVALGSIWVPWTWDPVTGATWGQYIKFTIFFVSVTAARIWTAFIALEVLLRQVLGRHLSLKQQSVFYILGIALPSVITAALLLTAHNTSVLDINPAFHYGRTQQMFSVVVCLGCLSICLFCLILFFRKPSSTGAPTRVPSKSSISSRLRRISVTARERRPLLNLGADGSLSPDSSGSPSTSASPEFSIDTPDTPGSPAAAAFMVDETAFEGQPPKLEDAAEDSQIYRHFLLLIFLAISMFFGACICLWRLVREVEGGVFIVVEFLDQAFNFGQGILIFAVFGIDTELIVAPISRLCSRVKERIWLLSSGLPASVRLVKVGQSEVELFVTSNLADCMAAITGSLTLSDYCLSKVFSFADFHDWLWSRQLTDSREATLSLLLALEEAGIVRRLSPISGPALFRNSSSLNAVDDRLNFKKRASLFQYLAR
nr:unnamed protein product [Spirometra erinaceieuropaei]